MNPRCQLSQNAGRQGEPPVFIVVVGEKVGAKLYRPYGDAIVMGLHMGAHAGLV
jgi:hypothetical protein